MDDEIHLINELHEDDLDVLKAALDDMDAFTKEMEKKNSDPRVISSEMFWPDSYSLEEYKKRRLNPDFSLDFWVDTFKNHVNEWGADNSFKICGYVNMMLLFHPPGLHKLLKMVSLTELKNCDLMKVYETTEGYWLNVITNGATIGRYMMAVDENKKSGN